MSRPASQVSFHFDSLDLVIFGIKEEVVQQSFHLIGLLDNFSHWKLVREKN
jgi:hypothetical protein